jgi:hypothetical protein
MLLLGPQRELHEDQCLERNEGQRINEEGLFVFCSPPPLPKDQLLSELKRKINK